jgi:DNA/RNA endonuclease YhcR with UshA esterase domain
LTECPSCGRYVGPYDACPHCGAALSGRTPVRTLKIAALALALGGLALLWLVATHSDVPTVEIGQVNAMMNLAYVRVEGLVTRAPTYDPETGYYSFWLTDDSGDLHVAAYRNETRRLMEQGRAPALGDRVTVQGTLRIREDYVALTINLPEHLQITRAEAVDRRIGDIGVRDEFQRVRVRGQVRGIRVPYPGLTLIGLRDETGEIPLAVSEVITALGNDLPALGTGQIVEVVAPVSLYKDTPQLSLARAADLTVLDGALPLFPQPALGEIDGRQVDQWVVVSGRITDVTPFSAGVKYTLDDGTGQCTLLLWQNIYDQLAKPEALSVGATLQVQGQLAAYLGEVEIVPELPADIELLTSSRTAMSTPATVPELIISELDPERLGARVTLRGSIQDATGFAQGFKFTLDDGSGKITLLTWLDVYDAIVGRERLRPSASVQVTGQIGQFEGELQIVPSSGGDVTILAAGTAKATEREIDSLSGDDLGSWVTIAGQVTRVAEITDGERLFIKDDSGEVLVLLWQNVLERLPDGAGLPAVGAEIRATGRVEDFQGALEVVPALPCDVEIIPSAAAVSAADAPAPETPVATPTTATLPIGELQAGWTGQEVTVTGQVVDTASFSQGFKFTLDDGSGRIVLLLWHDLYDTCPDAPALNVGAMVRAAGQIGQFEGELQIQPATGTDVQVLAPSDHPAPERKLGAIGSQVGQRITLAGQVLRSAETDGGLRLFLGDASDEVLVFIWPNVLERIPSHQALGVPGTTVRVTGVVQEYRGDLELVPALPYDVEVIQ